jgi:hypothetical protein
VPLDDRGKPRKQRVLLRLGPLNLDDQERLGLERIAGMGESLAGMDAGAGP